MSMSSFLRRAARRVGAFLGLLARARPSPCIIRHPYNGQRIVAIHTPSDATKPKFVHFVALGELGAAVPLSGTLTAQGSGGSWTAASLTPPTTHWVIPFRIRNPDPNEVYDLTITDQNSGTTLAVCKNIQFREPGFGNTISSPANEPVCPTFQAYGAGTTASGIDVNHCTIGNQPANVSIIQDTDPDGAWIVQFNNCNLTGSDTTTITVCQLNGDCGQSGGIMVTGCLNPPPPP